MIIIREDVGYGKKGMRKRARKHDIRIRSIRSRAGRSRTTTTVTTVALAFIIMQCSALQTPQRHVRIAQRTALITRMVLTTPEAIIEKASTTKLLDDLIDESVRTSARRPFILQFDPSSGWIWRRWKGTVFSETWDSCVYKMIYACIVYLSCKSLPQIMGYLSGFSSLWGQLLSVTTFTLTFFVNQSYALWRNCSNLSRRLQGRLHDLDLTLAAHAARKPSSSPNEPSTYTPGARQVLELVSRYVRLFNLLTYASFTRSHRPMLTPRGMRRLVERGLMTPIERQVLVDCEVPATQRHNAVLLWIVRAFIEGKEAGHFIGDSGFEQQFIEKVHVCRASYGAIGDELQGRMPLAYAHIVQVLVDLVLWMYPFMAYSSGMSGILCVLGTGLLTMSYQGLFDLAKQFLDPYDNENYGKGEDPLVVDTLIAETNAGSVRWMHGLEQMPVSSQRFKDGELSDYLLPLRGWSVEELKRMEEERLELQEKREREEQERIRQELYDNMVREAAKAMIPNQFNVSQYDTADDDVYVVVYDDTGDRTKIPKVLSSPTYSVVETVGSIIFSQNSNATSLQQDLIPRGTAPASAYVAEIPELIVDEPVEEEVVDEAVEEKLETSAVKERILFGGADFDEDFDNEFQVIEDWGTDVGYVHKFEGFDPYLDVPWHDEVGPDGKEYRLSQMLADEVWEQEIEYAKEKEAIQSYDEYVERVREMKYNEASELLETERILSAAANSQEEYNSLDKNARGQETYDQTKLDSISQLFGLPPDELSELPSYEEPPVPPTSFSTISQLWNSGLPGSSVDDDVVPLSLSEDESSFSQISQLWGGDLDDDSKRKFPQAPPATSSTSSSDDPDKVEADNWIIDTGRVGQGARLSQMLANEDYGFEAEPAPPTEKKLTFEDYERQVQEILEAEKEEMLETEAILNAPPGADGFEVPEKDEKLGLNAMNATEADDLSVLEMDVPLNAVDSLEIAEAFKEGELMGSGDVEEIDDTYVSESSVVESVTNKEDRAEKVAAINDGTNNAPSAQNQESNDDYS